MDDPAHIYIYGRVQEILSKILGFWHFRGTFSHSDELPSNCVLTLAYQKKFGAQTFKICYCFEIWGGGAGTAGGGKMGNHEFHVFFACWAVSRF